MKLRRADLTLDQGHALVPDSDGRLFRRCVWMRNGKRKRHNEIDRTQRV
ncbi:MAG: hypothetical protein MZV64_35520 [Ignavibacteriales bacterium]|nr:hypothetical protein [Ignavibacteriales bacterium]